MMEWLALSWNDTVRISLSTLGVYIAIIFLVRVIGLRSLASMSGFDFATTVAIGAILGATTTSKELSLPQGVLALAVLLGLQYVMSLLRGRFSFADMVDNRPLLLMEGPRIMYENLRRVHVAEEELFSKLRAANVFRLDEVRAVVMERTGSLTVLHGDPGGKEPDEALFKGVRRE